MTASIISNAEHVSVFCSVLFQLVRLDSSPQRHACRLLTLDVSEVQCDMLTVSGQFSPTHYFSVMTIEAWRICVLPHAVFDCVLVFLFRQGWAA